MTVILDQARTIALRWLSEAKHGADPAQDKSFLRQSPTVAELAERYLSEHAKVKKRASSVRSDEMLLRLHILPKIGGIKINSVSREDVAQLHHSMRDKPIMANRALALLSKMFNLAEKWRLRPDHSNPCRHVGRYKERIIHKLLLKSEPWTPLQEETGKL